MFADPDWLARASLLPSHSVIPAVSLDDYMRSEAHSKSHRTGDLGRGSREGRPSGQVLKMIGFQAVMGNQGYLCRLQGSGWPLCNTKGSIAATEGREGSVSRSPSFRAPWGGSYGVTGKRAPKLAWVLIV
jgi:hypothetical protein